MIWASQNGVIRTLICLRAPLVFECELASSGVIEAHRVLLFREVVFVGLSADRLAGRRQFNL